MMLAAGLCLGVFAVSLLMLIATILFSGYAAVQSKKSAAWRGAGHAVSLRAVCVCRMGVIGCGQFFHTIFVSCKEDRSFSITRKEAQKMKIAIYQINTNRDKNDVKFMDPVTAEIDRSIYDLVFAGEVDAADLEDVFWIFNERHPEGYAVIRFPYRMLCMCSPAAKSKTAIFSVCLSDGKRSTFRKMYGYFGGKALCKSFICAAAQTTARKTAGILRMLKWRFNTLDTLSSTQ